MFRDDAPAGLDRLPAAYARLLVRALDVAAADGRVRAVWLGGSIARGEADASSDLDLLLAVADDAVCDVVEHWSDLIQAITPTVLSRAMPKVPGASHSLTPTCERLDVIVEPVRLLPRTRFRTRLCVLDKDALNGQLPSPVDGPGPDPAAATSIVEEFWRQQALFAVVVARADWLLGVEAVVAVRSLLRDLFLEIDKPAPVRGVKQWSAALTADQRRVLAGLRTPAAAASDVVSAMRSASETFREQAPAALVAVGGAQPDALASAITAHLDARLGEESPTRPHR